MSARESSKFDLSAAGALDGASSSSLYRDATFRVEHEVVRARCPKARAYPAMKYYGRSAATQPDFLTKNAAYVRGEPPSLLPHAFRTKLCVHTEEWETGLRSSDRLPFSDGQNPSVLALRRADESERIDPVPPPLRRSYDEDVLATMFAAVVYVGGAQCAYGLSAAEKAERRASPLDAPPTLRALFLLLDEDFTTKEQTTVLLEHDVPKWGKKAMGNDRSKKSVQQLDDPRLFLHRGELWVLYRNGKAFGYDKQLHNRLRFGTTANGGLEVYVRASETVTSCCGRNMAMISSPASDHDVPLRTVTWVDPFTVETVDAPSFGTEQRRRRLGREKKKKSDVHGTNGYMVPFGDDDELLGIAHFHRPEHRAKSDYALHGHHYTHAFFTMSTEEPHTLRSMSNEFLFRSLGGDGDHDDDGEVIQFASGVDVLRSDNGRDEVLLSYGVNDCESAVLKVDAEVVRDMLQRVEPGQEVADLMAVRKDLTAFTR